MSTSFCRVCLKGNTTSMYETSSTRYFELYEQMTGEKLVVEAGRPDSICFFCNSEIQRFYAFFEMAQNSENKVTNLLESGTELLSLVEQSRVRKLSSSAITHTSTLYVKKETNVSIKVEALEELPNAEHDLHAEVKFDEDSESNPLEAVTVKAESNKAKNIIVYPCQNCPRRFNSTKDLNQHNIIFHKHHGCFKCGESFLEPSHLKMHMRFHRGEIPFASDSRNDKMSNLIVSTGGKFACGLCSRIFSHKGHLKTHIMAIHTGERPFSCIMCDKKFVQRSNLLTHMKRTHTTRDTENKRFHCEICSKRFGYKFHLKTHIMAIHNGQKPFSCTICSKKFLQRGALKVHKRYHTGEKSSACHKLCDNKCNVSLKNHITSHRGEQTFTKSCLDSLNTKTHTKTYRLKSDVQNVLKKDTLHNEKFWCDTCKKSFHPKSAWKRHMRIHSTERPFACLICNKYYKEEKTLKLHMKIHTGDKQFACDRCDKKFFQKCNLTSHMRIHSGEKPFVCDRCGNSFNQKSHLRTHILFMHTADRPFSCDVCNKRFTLQSCLRKHKVVHTGVRPYACDRCKNKYLRKSQLNSHVAKMHTRKIGP